MKKLAMSSGILAAALTIVMYAAPASAQATRTWVSGVGNDANPCSRTAPCKTFAGAISKTAAKGEINCLDPNGAGAVTITKSITINCENTLGGILVGAGTGVVINLPSSADTVTLKGLDIEGTGLGSNGIRMVSGGILHVHKVQIRNMATAGIDISNAAAAEVYVSETYISASGTGIVNTPGAVGSSLTIYNVRVENNTNGITLNRTAAGATKASISESTVTGNGNNGVTTSVSAGTVDLMLKKVVVTNNGSNGVSNNGAGSTTRIGDSVVNGNATAVANAAGIFRSYKNNQIDGNTAVGALPLPQENFN